MYTFLKVFNNKHTYKMFMFEYNLYLLYTTNVSHSISEYQNADMYNDYDLTTIKYDYSALLIL